MPFLIKFENFPKTSTDEIMSELEFSATDDESLHLQVDETMETETDESLETGKRDAFRSITSDSDSESILTKVGFFKFRCIEILYIGCMYRIHFGILSQLFETVQSFSIFIYKYSVSRQCVWTGPCTPFF